ncbi:tyrosine-type recombinase/integrase [Mongoliimonas terrestris]|uniref:tyrosine-type recombinase/integrase n=1 Tax=Mongoliimonas terrestris TaxID=1709001 RepID=UPI000949A699|nr:site-specific integrase [Mongoliimonas terrestris]
MSVYRPKNAKGEFTSPFYHYDFQCRGRRFFGSTGETAKRDAERVQEQKRREARALMADEAARETRPMTVHDACERYWLEVGQYLASSDDTWSYLRRIEKAFGASTLISSITTNKISLEVARRRGDGVKSATVNRTLTEPLRRVLRKAEKAWDQKVRPIDWKELLLPEPLERVREATDEEEERLSLAIRDDYRPAFAFMLLTGCRLEEVVTLTWDRVYWTAKSIEIRGKGHRGTEEKIRQIPITPDVREILWSLRKDHAEAVFTFVARRADKKRGIARGDRVPISYEGLKTRWQRDRAEAGVRDFRLHDTRHTALTRLVRETGNLKLAQKLAGHTDISTTAKYAHATLDDLRNAMDRVAKSRNKSRNDDTKAG